MSIFRRGFNFIGRKLSKPHNMLTSKAEQYYFLQYFSILEPLFKKDYSILDIGCQYGRFTIPAYQAGLTVTATDINQKYFRAIEKKIPKHSISFRHETIDQSCELLPPQSFDIILCLELLYNLPDTAAYISKLSALLKPGGLLVTSHRSKGYYLYRFIREKKFQDIQKILAGTHHDYNCQTPEELKYLFNASQLDIKSINPIGIFSGFGKDAFSVIANPDRLTDSLKTKLQKLETDIYLSNLFMNNARYLMVVAEKK